MSRQIYGQSAAQINLAAFVAKAVRMDLLRGKVGFTRSLFRIDQSSVSVG